MMYRKYGFGRGAAQASVSIRRGDMTREHAMEWVIKSDGIMPMLYGEVPLMDILRPIGIDFEELFKIMDRFTNWELFDKTVSSKNRLILKEFANRWDSQPELSRLC